MAAQTVLVIDDDAVFLAALNAVLTQAGYAVQTAATGADGLRTLEAGNGTICAAIVDLNLPTIGGFQVISAVGRGAISDIPVIAITGAYSDLYLEVAKYLGAQLTIRKPESGAPLDTILQALNTALSRQTRTA